MNRVFFIRVFYYYSALNLFLWMGYPLFVFPFSIKDNFCREKCEANLWWWQLFLVCRCDSTAIERSLQSLLQSHSSKYPITSSSSLAPRWKGSKFYVVNMDKQKLFLIFFSLIPIFNKLQRLETWCFFKFCL